MQLEEFSSRLVALGVIDGKAKRELDATANYSAPAANYRSEVDFGIENAIQIHSLAIEAGYADKSFADIINEVIRICLKFAKGNKNKKNVKNSTLNDYKEDLSERVKAATALRDRVLLNTKNTRGENGMNAKKELLEIIKVYKRAISELKNGVRLEASIALLDKSNEKIEKLEEAVRAVADSSSKEAARIECEIFEHLEKWAQPFSSKRFTEEAVEELDEAVRLAAAWGLVAVNLKAKPAKEGDIKTTADVNDRLYSSSYAQGAKTKIEQLKDLTETYKRDFLQSYDTSRYDERVSELEPEIEKLNEEKDVIYAKLESGILDEIEWADRDAEIDESIEELEGELADILEKIRIRKDGKKSFEDNVDLILDMCDRVLEFGNMPTHLVKLADAVDFEVVNCFLEGNHSDEILHSLRGVNARLEFIYRAIVGREAIDKIRSDNRELRQNSIKNTKKTTHTAEQAAERLRKAREMREGKAAAGVRNTQRTGEERRNTATEDDN